MKTDQPNQEQGINEKSYLFGICQWLLKQQPKLPVTNPASPFYYMPVGQVAKFIYDYIQEQPVSVPNPYFGDLNTERIKEYKKLQDLYNISEGTIRDIFSAGIDFYKKSVAVSVPIQQDKNDKNITSELYKIGSYLVTGGQLGIESSSQKTLDKIEKHNDELREMAVRIKKVIDSIQGQAVLPIENPFGYVYNKQFYQTIEELSGFTFSEPNNKPIPVFSNPVLPISDEAVRNKLYELLYTDLKFGCEEKCVCHAECNKAEKIVEQVYSLFQSQPIIKVSDEDLEKEAVDFTEWMAEEKYRYLISTKKWTSPKDDLFTTQELYKEYILSKQK